MRIRNIDSLGYSPDVGRILPLSLGYKKILPAVIMTIILTGSNPREKQTESVGTSPASCETQPFYTTIEGRYIRQRACDNREILHTHNLCEKGGNYTMFLGDDSIEVRDCKDNSLIGKMGLSRLDKPL